TIVGGAVREGLPLAVTISLAYSGRKMAAQKNLVRKLSSCETMGAATVICSDKTGTLTKNRMSVVQGWLSGKDHGSAQALAEAGDDAKALFAQIASVNATAFLETREDGLIEYVGNPTECALLSLVQSWGVDWRAQRSSAQIVHQFGFTSDRKRMSTVVHCGAGRRRLSK
ncbi:unnamed protein product, partial [Laminaria digitata]